LRAPLLRLAQPLRHLLVAGSVQRPALSSSAPAIIGDRHVDTAVDEKLHGFAILMKMRQLMQDVAVDPPFSPLPQLRLEGRSEIRTIQSSGVSQCYSPPPSSRAVFALRRVSLLLVVFRIFCMPAQFRRALPHQLSEPQVRKWIAPLSTPLRSIRLTSPRFRGIPVRIPRMPSCGLESASVPRISSRSNTTRP